MIYILGYISSDLKSGASNERYISQALNVLQQEYSWTPTNIGNVYNFENWLCNSSPLLDAPINVKPYCSKQTDFLNLIYYIFLYFTDERFAWKMTTITSN